MLISATKGLFRGGWVSDFPEKKHYEEVGSNVIIVTRGWVGVKYSRKKRYLTLEWPQIRNM